MAKVVIVGAGMGGLAAALSLCRNPSWEITVVEALNRAGGKVGWHRADGVVFDTGPSLLTLPAVVEHLCEEAGCQLGERINLRRPRPAYRYRFADGTNIDIGHSPEETAANIAEVLGERSAREFRTFLEYARKIWEVAAPHFVWGEAPSFGGMLKLGIRALRKFRAVDPLRTMDEAICAQISDWRLRDFFRRYATYNGSDPRQAPATLNCICWVEHGLGFWGVEGGMRNLVQSLVALAEENGVDFRFGTPVRSIDRRGDRFQIDGDGVELDSDAVIVNADIGHLLDELAGSGVETGLSHFDSLSMSAWTAVIRASRRPADERPAHTVVFPERDYLEEFADIFDRKCPPKLPTIYLSAGEKAHGVDGWDDEEPIFVMINTPPVDPGKKNSMDWQKYEQKILRRLRKLGLIDSGDSVVWRRTPEGLAGQFPGSRGSIYGAASNGRMAAFRRPSNRVDEVPGLYLASGGAHPGGGVPLAMQSGIQAARELAACYT